MWDFYWELMESIGRRNVSKSIWWDMYWTREGLDGDDALVYERLCFVAVRLAKLMKGRLPEVIHNRMVLGPQNARTRQYVAYCVKLAAQK